MEPNRTYRSNVRHLYADVIYYGLLAGSAIAFLGVYAARLGANEFQVGLLTAGPAIVNLAISLPAGRWLEGRGLVKATFSASVGHRIAYLVIVALPGLFAPGPQVWWLVGLSAAMAVPGTVLAIAFNALLADLVPPEARGQVVGRRNALLSLTLTVTSLGCAWLLDHLVFPVNFQIVFGLGALGAVLSTYHLSRLNLSPEKPSPPRVGHPLGDTARPGMPRLGDAVRPAVGLRFLTRSPGRRLLRLDILRGRFGLLLFAYLSFYTIQYVPIPLFPLFWVRDLRLSDGTISIGNALFYAGMILASLLVRRLTSRLGHHRLLGASALIYGAYPLLNGLATGPAGYWLASAVGGSVWGLVNASLLNHLMDRTPPDDRPAHMALHNLVLNLGILAGSLLGPTMAQAWGLRTTLLLDAGLRAVAGMLLWVFG